jgi:hypothetical protein
MFKVCLNISFKFIQNRRKHENKRQTKKEEKEEEIVSRSIYN